MSKNWLIPIGLVIFFSVAVPVLFLENETTLAAGFRQNTGNPSFDANSPKAILAILDNNPNRLTPVQTNNLLFQLLTLQNSRKNQYESVLFSEPINSKINRYRLEDLVSLNIKDKGVKSLVQRILDDGFRLSSSEGLIYIEIDYPKLLKKYAKRTSIPISRYLKIMVRETARHFAEDAALMITPNDLADRILAIESFLHDYPDFQRIGDLTTLHSRYLSAYLLGLNNTPAFAYKTDRIEKSFLLSYQRVVAEQPKTELARVIRAYLSVLQKSRYQKTPDVLNFITKNV